MDKFIFFPGQRRRINLDDFAPKLNSEKEKRLLLAFVMPITGQPFIGLPNFLAAAVEALEKDGSAIDEANITTELEGVTMDIWATDKSEKRDQLITAATLRKFVMVRKREKEDTIVSLKFNCTIQASEKLLIWAFRNHGADMWIQFTETQPTLGAPADDKQMNLGSGGIADQEAGQEQPEPEDEERTIAGVPQQTKTRAAAVADIGKRAH